MAKVMTKTVYVRDAHGRTVVLRPGDAVPEGVKVNPKLLGTSRPARASAQKEHPAAATEPSGSLEDLSKEELIELAKAKELPHSGNKEELIERLQEA